MSDPRTEAHRKLVPARPTFPDLIQETISPKNGITIADQHLNPRGRTMPLRYCSSPAEWLGYSRHFTLHIRHRLVERLPSLLHE